MFCPRARRTASSEGPPPDRIEEPLVFVIPLLTEFLILTKILLIEIKKVVN